jgi:uncharacterized protein (UPF0332 family)
VIVGPQDYIAKSHRLLQRSGRLVETPEDFEVAARDACMAAFHAAEAVILARTGRIAKTHRGVRSELSRIGLSEPRLQQDFAAFLASGYRLKERDDYLIEPEALISREEARTALATATRLVAHAEWLLAQPEPPPGA